jgi:hypothetical protein
MAPVNKEILPLLGSILSGKYTIFELNKLVYIAYNFSLSRLRELINLGKLKISSIQIKISEAAMDCIAELFKQNNEGRFVELEDYFQDERDIHKLSEKLAHQHFRLLVFRKTQDGVFRLHWENDPIYSKIYRNLKIHLRQSESIKTFRMFEESYIYACDEEELNKTLPEFPIEEIEALLSSNFKGNQSTRSYLLQILNILNDQERYKRFISLTDVAGIIKRIMLRQMTIIENVYSINEDISRDDLPKVITSCIYNTRKSMHEKYVVSGNMQDESFDKFFTAVEEILFDTFVAADGEVKSYVKYLQKYMPELSSEEYRSKYHHQFEYMVNCVKKMVIEQLKEYL